MIKNVILFGLVVVFAVQFGLIDLAKIRDDLVNWAGDSTQPMTGESDSGWG